MLYGLKKIEKNKYKCFRYSIDRGVKKEHRDKYVIINEKEANFIRNVANSFYLIGSFFIVSAGRGRIGSPALFEELYHYMIYVWGILLFTTIVIFHYSFKRFYNNLFRKYQIFKIDHE
jgi:hypothetical protein